MPTYLQRKPTPLSAWQLTDQAAMLAALGDLSADGWRGSIGCDAATSTWRLELNADNPTRAVFASIGDWLVVDGELKSMSDAACAADYDVVP